MSTKVGNVRTYYDRLPPLKSIDPLIYVKSLSLEDLREEVKNANTWGITEFLFCDLLI